MHLLVPGSDTGEASEPKGSEKAAEEEEERITTCSKLSRESGKKGRGLYN